ncbi:hypothetical protein KCU61_g131, partial [Aureobasidium melanogenum]
MTEPFLSPASSMSTPCLPSTGDALSHSVSELDTSRGCRVCWFSSVSAFSTGTPVSTMSMASGSTTALLPLLDSVLVRASGSSSLMAACE